MLLKEQQHATFTSVIFIVMNRTPVVSFHSIYIWLQIRRKFRLLGSFRTIGLGYCADEKPQGENLTPLFPLMWHITNKNVKLLLLLIFTFQENNDRKFLWYPTQQSKLIIFSANSVHFYIKRPPCSRKTAKKLPIPVWPVYKFDTTKTQTFHQFCHFLDPAGFWGLSLFLNNIQNGRNYTYLG